MYQLPPAGGYPSVFKFLNRKSKSLELNTTLSQQFKQEVYLTNSGKSALYAVLLAQSRIANTGAKKVIIPNYCCPDLVFSIAKAGLQTELAPVSEKTLEVSKEFYKKLDSKDYLAVILPNLYGMLDAVPKEIDSKILIIDDVCQSLESLKKSRTKVTVFSAGRGKSICGLGGGGVIVEKSELANEVKKVISSFSKPSKDYKLLLSASLIPILENPYLFFLLNKIIKTGEVKINFDFSTTGISELEKQYAAFQYNLNANKFKQHMDWSSLIKNKDIIQPYLQRTGLKEIVFNRYPLILQSFNKELLTRLKRYGVNSSYQKGLNQFSQLKNYVIYDSKDNQDFLKNLVTLPTHKNVTKVVRELILEALRGLQ